MTTRMPLILFRPKVEEEEDEKSIFSGVMKREEEEEESSLFLGLMKMEDEEEENETSIFSAVMARNQGR